MGIKATMNKALVKAKVDGAWRAALPAISQQILDDANRFVKTDQGALRDSSYIASNLNEGILAWDTPYAKKQYYTGTPSTDVNPEASIMWVERARGQYAEDWEKVANNAFKEVMK